MIVYLDGKKLAQLTVSADERKEYKLKSKTVSKGSRDISIEFTNDAYLPEKDEDRNLFIQGISVRGPITKPKKLKPNRIVFLPKEGDKEQQAKNAAKVISRFASRAFRRPVYKTEQEKLVQFYHLARNGGETVSYTHLRAHET